MTSQASAPRFVVVVGVDGSEASNLVVENAARVVKATPGAEIHIVHVLENFRPEQRMEKPRLTTGTQILERAREHLQQLSSTTSKSFAGRVVGHLAVGDPWREVIQFAEQLAADLIVVGTEDLTGVRRLALGSVSEQVVRKAKCPVLVVRKTDYESKDVPEIEPACPECLAKQRATNGESLWCERHATHHPPAHLHYEEVPHWFGLGSGFLLPNG